MNLNTGQYIEKYRKIRNGQHQEILFEGIHAWKHAYRFGAKFQEILISDVEQIKNLPKNVLKTKEKDFILKNAIKIEESFFNKLIPYQTRSKILAISTKPNYEFKNISKNKSIIFLENPANPENIGMALRVCAAFGVGALIINGQNNIFSASVLRAGVGLVYAIPIFNKEFSKEIFKNRKIIVADAEGESIKKISIPKNSVIIFGTEREGVSDNLKKQCDKILKLDMEKNISSLNLATAISAFLYSVKFK